MVIEPGCPDGCQILLVPQSECKIANIENVVPALEENKVRFGARQNRKLKWGHERAAALRQ